MRDKSMSAEAPPLGGSRVIIGVAERLYPAFEGLGMTPYQARVQVALLLCGPANCVELTSMAGIPRTSVYQILDELDAKGLAFRVPGTGPARWSSMAQRDVLVRLVNEEEERLGQIRTRSAQVAEMIDLLLPGEQGASLPYVQQIHDPLRVARIYHQLLAETREELLVFNRPPYFAPIGVPQPQILETVARVPSRVLYQSAEAEAGDRAWHREMSAYHDAGVQGRVVRELTVKLAVFDRKSTLLSIEAPNMNPAGSPMTLLVAHPGYAELHAEAFQSLWDTAKPYEAVITPPV